MKVWKRFCALAVFALVTGLLAACGAGGGSGSTSATSVTSGASLQYILVSPVVPPALPLGGSQQFVATGYYSDGSSQDISSSVNWTSSSTSIATLTSGGAATASAVGSTSITASYGSVVSLPVSLSTMQAKLVSMTISSTNPASIGVGQTTQFRVQGKYSNGFTQDITPAASWYSAYSGKASVNDYFTTTPGLVTGLKPGTTTISASDILTSVSSSAVSITVSNTYAIGGTTSLLPAGSSVTLLNSIVDASGVASTDTVTVGANGSFQFPTTLAPGSTYDITVSSASLPIGAHPCTVVDGSGIINATTPVPALKVQLVCGPAVAALAGPISAASGYKDSVGAAARFNSPRGVAVNNATGDVYVADSMNCNIRVVSASGVVSTLAGSSCTGTSTNGTGTAATFGYVDGLAFDPASGVAGTLFVADSTGNTIRQIDIATQAVTTFSTKVSSPIGLALDSAGNLYVADSGNWRVIKITPAGAVTVLASGLQGPEGVAVNAAGTVVYFTDTNVNAVEQISGGTVSTLVGQMYSTGLVDGTGTDSMFNNPFGLTMDASGNLYVADYGNYVIRKVNVASAVVTTVAGKGMSMANRNLAIPADGPALSAVIGPSWKVTVDTSGNLYFSDIGGTIYKYTP